MALLRKCHCRYQQEKGHLQKDQELLMVDLLNIQVSIDIVGRDKGGEYQVVTIW